VRLLELEARIGEEGGDSRCLADEGGHVGKDFVADEIEQVATGFETPLGPAVAFRLCGEKGRAVESDAEQFGLGVLVFHLVEEFQIEQVGKLLDVGDGIGQAAGPHGIGDLVELVTDVGSHEVNAERLRSGNEEEAGSDQRVWKPISREGGLGVAMSCLMASKTIWNCWS
jgi:hypothetical protein